MQAIVLALCFKTVFTTLDDSSMELIVLQSTSAPSDPPKDHSSTPTQLMFCQHTVMTIFHTP